jgi:hypothetical protein
MAMQMVPEYAASRDALRAHATKRFN